MLKNRFQFGDDRLLLMALACAAVILIVFSLRMASLKEYRTVNRQNLPMQSLQTNDLSGLFDNSDQIAYFEGKQFDISHLEEDIDDISAVLGVAQEERWIEVDLSDQKLYAWEGDRLFLETKISTGLPRTPTPTGEFRIWIKLRATKMSGGTGRNYYYLPNVPYVMFFYNDKIPKYKGYGLHGTYWHNDFGNPRSHGCVNLPTPIAKEIYEWSSPVLPFGKSVVYESEFNPGTRIVIHD